MEIINKNIAFLRKERDWTQQQLAERLSVKRSRVAAYEEYRTVPSLIMTRKMSVVFEIDLESFIQHDLEKEKQNQVQPSLLKTRGYF